MLPVLYDCFWNYLNTPSLALPAHFLHYSSLKMVYLSFMYLTTFIWTHCDVFICLYAFSLIVSTYWYYSIILILSNTKGFFSRIFHASLSDLQLSHSTNIYWVVSRALCCGSQWNWNDTNASSLSRASQSRE